MDHRSFNCFHRCCLLPLLVVTVSQGQLPFIAVVQDPHPPTVGINLTLMCNVSTAASFPTITLRWKRDLKAIKEASFQRQFAKLDLTFSPLTLGDLGTYACETFIESEASFATASSVLSLDANSVNISGSTAAFKPEITIDTPPTPPVEGHPYTLTCSITNRILNVTPHIEWVGPDGQVINSSDEIIVGPVTMTTTSVSLPITFVSPSVLNSGIYTCRVDNGSPQRFVKISLDIQGVLTSLSINIQTKQAVFNMPYRADCIATIPSVLGTTTSLLWIFPDGSYLGKVSTLGTTSLSLVINSLQTSDVGKYICTMTVSSPALSAPILITKEMTISQDARNNDLPNVDPHPTRNDSVDSDLSPKRNNSVDSDLSPKRNNSVDSDLSPKGNNSVDSDLSPERNNSVDSDLSPKRNDSVDSDLSPKRNDSVDSDLSPKGNNSVDNHPIPTRNGPINSSSTTSKPNTKGNEPSVPQSGQNIKTSMPVSRNGIKARLKTKSIANQAVTETDKQNACSTPPRPPGGRPGPLGQPGAPPIMPRFLNNPPKTACSTIGTESLSGPLMKNLQDGRSPLTGRGQRKSLRRSKFVAHRRS